MCYKNTFPRVKILQQITAIFKLATMGQCGKTFTVVIYFHSTVITKATWLITQKDEFTMEWQ